MKSTRQMQWDRTTADGAVISDSREVPLASWDREMQRMADRIAADQCEGSVKTFDEKGTLLRHITVRKSVEYLIEG